MPPPPRAALADLAAVVSAGGGGGKLNPRGTGSTCRCGVRREGLPSLSPVAPLPLPSFLPPIPPTPFPGGEGGDFRLFHARGFAPCIPGIRPPAALTEPAAVVPAGGGGGCLNPGGTCFPRPGGEDHLKRRRRLRRIVPLPRSPLSLAAGTANRKAVLSVLRRVGDYEGTPPAGCRIGRSSQCRAGSAPGVPGASLPEKSRKTLDKTRLL